MTCPLLKKHKMPTVTVIPTMYPIIASLKVGFPFSLTSSPFCSLAFLRSTSYLKHNATNIPGITMSPRPRRAKGPEKKCSLGKSNLMGKSSPFATVTITSVPNTQKLS